MVVVFYNSVSLQESFKLRVHVVEISWTWISFVNLLHHAQVNYNRSQYSKTEQKSKDSCLLLFCGTPTEHLHRNGMLQVAVTCTVHGCCLGAKSCPTLCNPSTVAHQAPPSLGFSRQEHWSGLPFPSPMYESEKWKWSRSVVSDSSDPMGCSPPGSSVHGIFQARVLEWGAIAFSK